MSASLSSRLAAVVDALPLVPGLRVLEFGCGPGAAAGEVARRVGALDGRHPAQQAPSLARIAAALTPTGRLFIDGGSPLRELKV
ncbi:hypothetical protein [Kribbella sp. NPDC023855]|uniref:hypothetical protein n=1 Tax=Kribbella sp. NPDC023855 TaxID=3154698 RepID=UPI0033D91582